MAYPKGSRIPYSICLSSPSELIHLPVVLSRNLEIYNETDFKAPSEKFTDCTYSLGHILYGILWELSFHGSPASRDMTANQLKTAVKEIKQRESKSKLKSVPSKR